MTHELLSMYQAPLDLGSWIWRCSCGHRDAAATRLSAYRHFEEHKEIA